MPNFFIILNENDLNYNNQDAILMFISTNSSEEIVVEMMKNRVRDNDQAPFLVYVSRDREGPISIATEGHKEKKTVDI